MEKFHDLSFSRQPDGSIRLIHSDYGEDYIIDVHPVQLRHIAEAFGLVTPNYPADELSKRLAEQLGRVFLDMADDYRHLSHTLESTFERLDGFINALPDSVFPYHLWNEREEVQKSEGEAKELDAARQQAAQKAVTLTGEDNQQEPDENASAGQQRNLEV